MNLKKIEIIEDFGHEGERYYHSEQLFEPNEVADYFIKQGWAKDLGTPRAIYSKPKLAVVEARVPEATLEVQNIKHIATNSLKEGK